MYPYQKPQQELLLDLIKEANPDMPFPPAATNLRFGTPVTQAVPNGGIADTNILVSGKDPYLGTKVVQYRRINLDSFFRSMNSIKMNIWVSDANTIMTAQNVVDYYNKTFGLSLSIADTGAGSFAPNVQNVINITAGSLCYSGRLIFLWTPTKKDINVAIPGNSLPGRTFPGGNDFSPGFKPVGEYLCYDTSFVPLTATFAQIGASGTWSGNSVLGIPVTNFLKENVSPDFKGDQPHTVYGGLNGLSFIRVAIPIATVPEANSMSTVFKNVVAIIAQPNSWFRGKLLMHY